MGDKLTRYKKLNTNRSIFINLLDVPIVSLELINPLEVWERPNTAFVKRKESQILQIIYILDEKHLPRMGTSVVPVYKVQPEYIW
jgi:hypothetical protein